MASHLHNHVSILLLIVLLTVAYDSMWGLIFRNGYYEALVRLRDFGPHLLPGSNTPLQQHYTGLGPLDYWLTVLQAVFANVTDGSAPKLSIYAFQFAGQLVPVLAVMLVEGYRDGNRGHYISMFFLWACAMQGVGYGVIMPIYCAFHLFTAPTATSNLCLLRNSLQIRKAGGLVALPWALTLGYILPATLMSIPIFSSTVHQYLVVVWQMYPVWIIITLFCHSRLSRSKRTQLKAKQSPMTDNSGAILLKDLRRIYSFAIVVAALTQSIAILLVAGTKLLDPLSSFLGTEAASYRQVFLPHCFRGKGQIGDMVQGAHNFFQYDQYVGSSAALVWAVTLNCNAREGRMSINDWVWLIVRIIRVGIIAGPTGALLTLIWDRDESITKAGSYVRCTQ